MQSSLYNNVNTVLCLWKKLKNINIMWIFLLESCLHYFIDSCRTFARDIISLVFYWEHIYFRQQLKVNLYTSRKLKYIAVLSYTEILFFNYNVLHLAYNSFSLSFRLFIDRNPDTRLSIHLSLEPFKLDKGKERLEGFEVNQMIWLEFLNEPRWCLEFVRYYFLS